MVCKQLIQIILLLHAQLIYNIKINILEVEHKYPGRTG